MTGKRLAVKTFDWVKLGENIPAAAVSEFNAFKARHETIKGSLNLIPEKPTPVDFSHYASKIKNKALIEKFQAEYAKVKIPFPKDTKSAMIEQQIKEADEQIVEKTKEYSTKITELQSEVLKIKNQKPFEEMSLEEYLELHPEIKKEVDIELKEMGFK